MHVQFSFTPGPHQTMVIAGGPGGEARAHAHNLQNLLYLVPNVWGAVGIMLTVNVNDT